MLWNKWLPSVQFPPTQTKFSVAFGCFSSSLSFCLSKWPKYKSNVHSCLSYGWKWRFHSLHISEKFFVHHQITDGHSLTLSFFVCIAVHKFKHANGKPSTNNQNVLSSMSFHFQCNVKRFSKVTKSVQRCQFTNFSSRKSIRYISAFGFWISIELYFRRRNGTRIELFRQGPKQIRCYFEMHFSVVDDRIFSDLSFGKPHPPDSIITFWTFQNLLNLHLQNIEKIFLFQ